jgi:hypothetical protein
VITHSCMPRFLPCKQDLQCLGRDLSEVIIVDNSPHSYMFQPENALPIGTFIDDMQDQVGGWMGRGWMDGWVGVCRAGAASGGVMCCCYVRVFGCDTQSLAPCCCTVSTSPLLPSHLDHNNTRPLICCRRSCWTAWTCCWLWRRWKMCGHTWAPSWPVSRRDCWPPSPRSAPVR